MVTGKGVTVLSTRWPSPVTRATVSWRVMHHDTLCAWTGWRGERDAKGRNDNASTRLWGASSPLLPGVQEDTGFGMDHEAHWESARQGHLLVEQAVSGDAVEDGLPLEAGELGGRNPGGLRFVLPFVAPRCLPLSVVVYAHPRQVESYVVQRYVDNPYLVGGKKFDMRMYALVTSFQPLTIYIYRSGFARFSAS